MFNKAQRTELNALSLKVYGTESAWSKLHKDPQYQIVIGQREEHIQKYIRYQRKDGTPGTVVKLETAVEKYGFQATEEQLNKPVVITENRPATFDELIGAMKTTLEMSVHSQLSPEERQHVFACMFNANKLVYKLSLELGESEQTKLSFEEQLKLLDDDSQAKIRAMVSTKEEPIKGISVDAYGFTSDVVFCKNHTEKASELMLTYLSDAEKRFFDSKKGNISEDLRKKLYNEALNNHKRIANKKAANK